MPAMSTILSDAVDGLQAVLSCNVEEYHRLEGPTELTVYVQPNEQGEEEGRGVGNIFRSPSELTIIVEIPWDDKVATGTSVSDTVETIKEYIHDNRDLVLGYVTRHGTIAWRFAYRTKGQTRITYMTALVPLLITYPNQNQR